MIKLFVLSFTLESLYLKFKVKYERYKHKKTCDDLSNEIARLNQEFRSNPSKDASVSVMF